MACLFRYARGCGSFILLRRHQCFKLTHIHFGFAGQLDFLLQHGHQAQSVHVGKDTGALAVMGFKYQVGTFQQVARAALRFIAQAGGFLPFGHGGRVIQALFGKRTAAMGTAPCRLEEGIRQDDRRMDVAGQPYQVKMVDHGIGEIIPDKA